MKRKELSLLGICLLIGCTGKKAAVAPVQPVKNAAKATTLFEDATKASGINFTHNNGSFGAMLMPEIMGSGSAWIDYDGDGYPDLFIVNSRDWTPEELAAFKSGTGKDHPELTKSIPARKKSTCRLYHNNGNGTFTDVSAGSGVDVETYGMGATVGDYDNDGKPDLYLTALGRNYLFHNEGGGKFKDVSAAQGVTDSGWSTSAVFLDFDKDGKLDLFVCHYVAWKPGSDIYCQSASHNKDYCTPESYRGEFCKLYHNDGGKFTDVSAQAGILSQKTPEGKMRSCQGKSLGVAVADFNGDGWPDIVVANDLEPNYLFQNNKNGTFTELGREAGIALNEAGIARAAMGVNAADMDRSGRPSLVFGNFSNQMLGLYQNQGAGLFIDVAAPSGIGQPSLRFLAFGTIFVDVDNDTWPDLFVANGHVEREVEVRQRDVTFKERPLLFINQGKGQFGEVGLLSGDVLKKTEVWRGIAAADYDLDGNVDVLLTANGGPATLMRNKGSGKHSLRLTLEGVKSNRSAIGASVTVTSGSNKQSYMVKSGSSYCSASELALTIGLGDSSKADSIEIDWPSGEKTSLKDVAAKQSLVVVEGKGIVKTVALK